MRPILLKCPSCEGSLSIRRLECPACGLSIESEFALPAVMRLSRAQMDFVEVFIKNRGVIRDVERELGCSYPTVRAKLDEVVAAMGFAARETPGASETGRETARRGILDDLRAGRISPQDALRALRVDGKQAASTEEKKDG